MKSNLFKDKYEKNTKKIVKKFKLNDNQIFISKISPYLFIGNLDNERIIRIALELKANSSVESLLIL